MIHLIITIYNLVSKTVEVTFFYGFKYIKRNQPPNNEFDLPLP